MISFRSRTAGPPPTHRTAGLLLAASLALLGCLAIYNATAHAPQPYYFLYRQGVWLLAGLALMGVASRLSRATWQQLTVPLGLISLLLLYALLLWGHTVNGMRGWFRLEITALAPYFSPILIQPSELSKPIFVLVLAQLAVQLHDPPQRSWRAYGLYLACCSLWLLPLVLQPDFGTLSVYLATMLLVYWLQGGRTSHLATTIGAGAALMGLAVVLHPYVRRRLAGFMDPASHAEGAGWHILQFRTTLAHGGLTGADPPIWSQHYLPLGYSDSIFATVAERIGFIGLLPILLVIVLWLTYGLLLARRQADSTSALVIAGQVSLLAMQAVLHISVTLGLLPPTGITFPLLSYGGSSLAASLLAIGIIIAFSKPDETGTVHL